MIARITPRMAGIALAVLTLIRLVVAALTPLSPDEAYYWVWSHALAGGYPDHPPMVAFWVRIGTDLAGQGALGVRLLGPLSAALGTVLLYYTARSLIGTREAGLRAAILLNATILFGAGAVTMTPDTPLLFFWTVALWGMGRLIQTGRPLCWLVIGVACGLAMCSKYTAILFPLGILVWLFWARGQWRWLLRWSPWLGALLGLACFVPTLMWNERNHWVSFAKQGGRSFVFHPADLLGHLGELVGGQAGLATPIIFILCIAGLGAATRAAWTLRHPASTLLVAMTLPAIVIFIEHAIGDRVQPNWPAIIYPAAAIAACLTTGRILDRLFIPGILLGLALTALVYVQSVAAPFHLPVKLDPTLRLSGGYADLAHDLVGEARDHGASFIALDDYGPASLVADLAPGCLPVIAIEPRWYLFDLPDGTGWMDGHPGLLLRSTNRHTPPNLADWANLTRIGTLTRSRAGQIAETYSLYEGTGRPGAISTVLLPCGRPDSPFKPRN